MIRELPPIGLSDSWGSSSIRERRPMTAHALPLAQPPFRGAQLPAARTVFGRASYILSSQRVQAALTKTGGHLGPVSFDLGDRAIQPYAIAPWWNERQPPERPVMQRVLRGDFFCLPFGGCHGGDNHMPGVPTHGDTAARRWRFRDFDQSEERTWIELEMRVRYPRAHVLKRIELRVDHTAIYQSHVIRGVSGPICFGHHGMLQFSDGCEAAYLSSSPFPRGQVLPDQGDDTASRERNFLRPGSCFTRLEAVEDIHGGLTDISRFPARRGYDDLVMLAADPSLPFAWDAVSNPTLGYVWFSLRDPAVLASTILWLSNGGIDYPPWNGRHMNVLGLENVTSYFDYGLHASSGPNPFSDLGFKTSVTLSPDQSLAVRAIFGVAAVPRTFSKVDSIVPVAGGIELVDSLGARVRTPLDLEFIAGEG